MRLIGNIEDFRTNESYKIAVKKSNIYNPKGRDKERHIKDIHEGEVLVEAVVVNYFSDLGMKKETSYTWCDAINKFGKRFEIKMTRINSKWWNFCWERYKHFLQNSEKLDYIIHVYLDEKTSNLYLKYIANAKTFERFTSESNRTGGSPYYNHLIAGKDCNIY